MNSPSRNPSLHAASERFDALPQSLADRCAGDEKDRRRTCRRADNGQDGPEEPAEEKAAEQGDKGGGGKRDAGQESVGKDIDHHRQHQVALHEGAQLGVMRLQGLEIDLPVNSAGEQGNQQRGHHQNRQQSPEPPYSRRLLNHHTPPRLGHLS